MKTLNSYLTVAFLFIAFSLSANNIIDCNKKSPANCKIKSYLSSINFNSAAETATIFSNFLVNENGDLFTIDFMITDDGEIEILSKDYEEEYYKVDLYSTVNMIKYSFPVASINSDLIQA